MVTEAVAEAVGLTCEVAEIRTPALAGTIAGAEYRPEGEMVPIAEVPPGTPLTAQVTVAFAASVTVAANCCVPLTGTFAEDGETVTDTAEGKGEAEVRGTGVREGEAPHPQRIKATKATT